MSAPEGGPAGYDQEGYEALRRTVGAVPIPRDVVRLAGVDAVPFLQGQLSQDVAALAVGDSADSLVLGPQGKLEALVRVTRTGEEEMLLDTEGGFGPALVARLERFKLRVRATVELLDWRGVALRGPRASAALDAHALAPGTALAVRFSWDGAEGMDLLGPDPAVPAGTPVCASAAWESLRVEAGIPRMGAELDERTIPAEAGLLERTVSFTKGCYTGQELVARLEARGNRVARRLRGLVLDAAASRAAPAVEAWVGADLVGSGGDARRAVGTVTSVAWSPALGRTVGLGYVHRAVAPGQSVEVRGAVAGTVAEVRTLPLVSAG